MKDERVNNPTPKSLSWPEELHDILAGYGLQNPAEKVDITRYEENDLLDGLIIDITADQFNDYDNPVFVDYQDSLHQSFDFIQAHDYDGLCDGRLYSLYRTIKEYL